MTERERNDYLSYLKEQSKRKWTVEETHSWLKSLGLMTKEGVLTEAGVIVCSLLRTEQVKRYGESVR
ncbi:hypothetical protein LX64_02934 [Chitinophaga skermanii]|uniref:Uncharacterized protein n=1 Tax=Chitinophaga skermanii TaxID=331697 RepID=A0A327QQI8_9BACT|nr:hypothetical protein [Chitinophaga skermanii]RAJ04057.1 hypothetical protein LX64_02934 [Chitinophaga skermanii]